MLRTGPALWVLGFLVGLASLAWSATVSVPIAVAYWSELAGQVAMMVLLLLAGEAERVAGAVMRGYAAGACLIALVAWASPTMQDLRPGMTISSVRMRSGSPVHSRSICCNT